MRKFFDDFSSEFNEEKITEKTMTARAISTVAIMVACLIAMTVTAYAYFSCSVTSQFTPIRTANFLTKVSIQEVVEVAQTLEENAAPVVETESTNAEPPQVITSDNKAHKITGLKAGKTYQITIMPTEKNTAEHGFVIFAAYHIDASGNATLASPVYHTQQLGVDVSAPNGRRDVISFNLQLDADADLILYSHWGTSSYYGYENAVSIADGQEVKDLYVEQGETVTIAVTGAALEELEPTPTPIPELTPSPSPIPELTPTPVPEATSTPTPTGEPAATAEPTATSAPESTEAPTSAPEATEAPVAQPTEAPAAEPTTAPVVPTEPVESGVSETTGEATSSESEATSQSETPVETTTFDTPQTTSEASTPIE